MFQEFTVKPKSQAVMYNGSITLNCEAKLVSSPLEQLSYAWYLNGGPRPQGSSIFVNNSLLIQNIHEAELGNYTCVVSSGDGSSQLAVSPPAQIKHAYIRSFVMNPNGGTVTEGDTITLDCVTGESSPPPGIFWEKDGVLFRGGSQYNATYKSASSLGFVQQFSMKLVLVATPEHSGKYNCAARNSMLGITVRSLQVFVGVTAFEFAARVDLNLYKRDILTPKDQPFILDCPIIGYPTPVITWKKGQVPLTPVTTNHTLLSNGSLYFQSFQLEDQGYYICEGINKLGRDTSPDIVLQAAYIDFEFSRHPTSKYAIAGLPTTLPCSPPTSNPPAKVTWYKNNQPLTNKFNNNSKTVLIMDPDNGVWDLFISDVQRIHEGEYFCVAENVFAVPTSRTSKVATLRVGGAPTFVQPPLSQSVIKGQGLVLICLVQGDPEPEITWLFNGQPVTDGAYTTAFSMKNQELHIANVNKAWEGYFTCRANNSYGKSEAMAYVTVKVPVVITKPVVNLTVTVNNQVFLPCEVYGDPAPNITWYKDQGPLSLSSQVRQTVDGLFINDVNMTDEGTYTCLATNEAGTAQSSGILIVQAPPVFKMIPKNVTVVIGGTANFNCSVGSHPASTIVWQFNDTNLLPDGVFINLDNSVHITTATWQHVGKYTCVASNVVGSENMSAKLSLQVPPKVKYIQGDLIVVRNRATTLTCKAEGIPAPHVIWYRRGSKILSTADGRIVVTSERQLLIKVANAGDGGDYTCSAVNEAGSDQAEVSLHIVQPPLPPTLLDPIATSSTSVTLRWTPVTQNWYTSVTNYIAYYKQRHELTYTKYDILAGANDVSHNVQGLQSGAEYLFVVTATNQAGEGGRSNSRSAKTFNADPSSPRNVHISNVASSSITVSWEVPEKTNGIIQKYQIWYQISQSNEGPEKIQVRAPTTSYTVTGLLAYTKYQFNVRAATVENDVDLWGNFSTMVVTRTEAAAPGGAPLSVEVRPMSSTEVQVSWQALSNNKHNGPLKFYHIRYKSTAPSSGFSEVKTVNFSETSGMINNLQPWTEYAITVEMENVAGTGPPSPEVKVRTYALAPSSPPTNIRLTAVSSSVVSIQFKLPDPSTWNSDISGIVVEVQKDGDKSSREVTLPTTPGPLPYNISDLEPWTLYNVRVALYTSQADNGTGPWSEWRLVQTQQSEPDKVRQFGYQGTPTSITVYWSPPLKPNGVLDFYVVKHYPLPNGQTNKQNGLTESAEAYLSPVPYPVIYNACDSLIDLNSSFSSIMDDILQEILENRDSIMMNNFSAFVFNFINLHLTSNNVTDEENFNLSLSIISDSFSILDLNALTWISAWNRSVFDLCSELLWVRNGLIYKNTTATRTVLENLQPSTEYVVGISAINPKGEGTVSVHTAKTDSLPPPPSTPNTTDSTTTNTTTALSNSLPQGQEDKLPVYLGGVAAGAVLVIFILAIVLCICIKQRERQNLVAYGNFETRSSEGKFGEMPRDRSPSLSTKDASEDNNNRDTRHSTSRIHFLGDAVKYGTNSTVSETQSYGHLKESQSVAASSTFPGIRIHKPDPTGIENLSYKQGVSDPGGEWRPDRESICVSMDLSAEEVYSRASTLQRKGQLKTENAEAIAVMRNSNLPLGVDDTDSLIPNDSVVIFAERTAL
ncbi:cell adhesion molecule DSCAML1-like [Saccostrea echinata]|uniref:cell adhesion molecule DSCAML1-like n=1 Tax=Saccostrea echinata TaxID=191078 RepID=UPI002A82A116|nr:cell adhesion molecule DSCAML1-like [Saccostrea echinata]